MDVEALPPPLSRFTENTERIRPANRVPSSVHAQTSRRGGFRRHGSRRPANDVSAGHGSLPVPVQPQPGGPEGGGVRHHDVDGHHQRSADVPAGLPVGSSRSEEKSEGRGGEKGKEEEEGGSWFLSLTRGWVFRMQTSQCR